MWFGEEAKLFRKVLLKISRKNYLLTEKSWTWSVYEGEQSILARILVYLFARIIDFTAWSGCDHRQLKTFIMALICLSQTLNRSDRVG